MKTAISLRTKLILGTILAVVLLSAALMVNMFTVMNYLNYSILSETMRPMAKAAALAVQGNLHMLVDRIFLIRDNDVFTNENATNDEKYRVLQKAESGIEFVWLALYSAEGELQTGTKKSPPLLATNFIGEMSRTQNLVINDVHTGVSDQELEIVIGTPIISGETITNFLVGSYKYEILSDVLVNLNISLNSRAYIINEYGKFMAHQDITRVISGESIFDYFPMGPEINETLGMMKGGQIDSVGMGSGVRRNILSFAPIRGTQWTLTIDVPLIDFIAPIRSSIMLSFSIIIVMMVFFALAAHFFISRILTEPLKIITESAQSITRGIFKIDLPGILVRREDEIGLLARSFVSMSQSLAEVIGEIEENADFVGSGYLDKRIEFSSTEGDFYKIISGVNSALDVICSHLDAIPVALALYNEKKEMLYHNFAMDEFLIMHEFTDYDADLLEHIAGSGGLTPGQTIDPQAEAIFDPAHSVPEPFVADIALLGHEGGSNFALTIQRTQLNNKKKNSICAILLLTDVTMLTRAKIDAEAASRAKSDFLSRMSHEIRTPMNAVMGMTQIAKSTVDKEKIYNCLDQIENSSQHLLGVINDILDFSKIEAGKLQMDITEFSLTENLNFVISMMLPKAKERHLNIRLVIEDIKNDGISTDSLRLNQILINLISNAIKFSNEGSEIVVKIKELGSEYGTSIYRFEVIDHGIGISEYHASKLFKPFEQADGSITRIYGGTGLGLVICKNLVEMMGGKISLESKKGEGSTFIFTLICASKPTIVKKESAMQESAGDSNYNFSGKRCLVVDDIDINREIILELLSITNMAMETAENGLQAFEKFKTALNGYYDLILMDMQMPVMDGCMATSEIRRLEAQRAADKEEEVRNIPIIAMTANVLQEDIQKAIDSGMNAHLAKPIDLEATLKIIQEQLSINRR